MAGCFTCGRSFPYSLGRWHSHVVPNVRFFCYKTANAFRISSHFRYTTTYFTNWSPKTVAFDGLFFIGICKRKFNSSPYISQRKVLSSSTMSNLPSVRQIEQFLKSKDIPYEHGHTSIVVGCFLCGQKGTSGEKTTYINKTTGSYSCKNCGRFGSWGQFKDGNRSSSSLKEQDLNQPRINATSFSDSNQKAAEIWNTREPLQTVSDNVKNQLREIFNLKKISDASLLKYQVHIVEYKFSEQSGHSSYHPCIVFPWFDSSRSAVHGVKLVRIEEVNTEAVALHPRYGALGLFGWNTVPPDAKEVVLTLSEFDAIAVHQETSYHAISLPLGTHSLPPEVLPQMEQFERIILWFGEDVRARQAANQFSKKLNIQRCHIVRPPVDNPPSGPLDALNKGMDLRDLITSCKSISHEKIATFQELRNDIYAELVNADQVSGVKFSRFPKLNSLLKGHRRGELTIFTGPTGAGKTTLLSEMSVDLCQQGVNTLWGSFEIRNVRLAKIMMNQFSGVDLQKNVQQFNYWADKFEMLPMYFMCFYGSQNIATVIETMAHAVYVFDIDHVIIDNLQFMTSSLSSEDRYSVQNHAISCLRDFASSKNVHLTLVIHPRKENDDVELQTASIFGTAKASQEADNVLILQDKKGRGEKYLQVTKNRFDGSVGRIPLEFVRGSLSMSGFGKKDNRQPKSFKESKLVSDVDMINIPSPLPIQKARGKTYFPRTQTDKGNLEKDKINDIKTHSPGFSKRDHIISGKAKLNFSSGNLEGVRIFQDNVSESIRSQKQGTKLPVASIGESSGTAQRQGGKKLVSKTVASLVAKHMVKNRVQTKKMASSQERLKPVMKSKA